MACQNISQDTQEIKVVRDEVRSPVRSPPTVTAEWFAHRSDPSRGWPSRPEVDEPGPSSSVKGDEVTMASTQQPIQASKDPLRHHTHYEQDGEHPSPYAGGSSFMERMAENVASAMGTVQFDLIGSLIILAWVFINGAVKYLESTGKAITKGGEFDPEPWILLNLIFSGVAFYTGALVIIAQKAQTRTDKANEEAAAKHRDELAQFQTDLLTKNTDLTEQIHTLSQKMSTLTEQVHEATCRRST
jgi:uncharacterized membrane protein